MDIIVEKIVGNVAMTVAVNDVNLSVPSREITEAIEAVKAGMQDSVASPAAVEGPTEDSQVDVIPTLPKDWHNEKDKNLIKELQAAIFEQQVKIEKLCLTIKSKEEQVHELQKAMKESRDGES